MNKILTNLKVLCTTEIGITLKKLKTLIKHINTFSRSLLTFMTIGFKNRNLKLNSRVIRTLGLLTVLQNHQKRNNRTPKNEDTYKIYKTLFETIKKRSKKKFYSEKLQKFKGDAKKTWSVMKEILGKCTTKSSTLPTKITVNKTDIFDTKKIADEFNKFFTNIGTDLANKIPNASKRFDFYITKVNTSMESRPLTINELKNAFFSLKINKSPGHDGVSFNVIKNVLMSYVNLSSIYLIVRLLKEFFLTI